MAGRITVRSTYAVVSVLAFAVTALVKCTGGDTVVKAGDAEATNIRFEEYAGSKSCENCHRDVYQTHLNTEHHLTSLPASDETVLGSFDEGKNGFAFDAATVLKMESRKDGFYQVHYQNGEMVRKEKMDLVVGSGRKGQSYLAWKDSTLSQLPITYFSPAKQWSNSPGYPPSKVVFDRPVTSRCLECHSTFFEAANVATFQKAQGAKSRRERLNPHRTILGVECEKCHGPAAQHVQYQSANPQATVAKFVVNPGKLPRERIMDFCSLCHGGPLRKTKPSFQFQAGDTLSNFFSIPNVPAHESALDVHGNQTGLLAMSKCFQLSNMTCLSCHDVHKNESNQLTVFSQRCANCHSKSHGKECKMTATLCNVVQQNCIDCHMPKQPSHAVAVYLQGASSPTPALLRTHYIKIYPEETRQSLKQQKGGKK